MTRHRQRLYLNIAGGRVAALQNGATAQRAKGAAAATSFACSNLGLAPQTFAFQLLVGAAHDCRVQGARQRRG